MLWAAVDRVRAYVTKNEDRLGGVWIVLDVKGEHVFACHMPFPDVGVALHLPDAQRGMKWWVCRTFLKELKGSSRLILHALGELGVGFQERLGRLKFHVS